MKSPIWLAASTLLLSAPLGLSQSELETLRSRSAEQERQIRQLEEENARLRSLVEKTSRPSTPPASAEPAAPSPSGTYTIRSGDTLAKVAREHGTTVAAIAKLNNIKNPARISIGQKIKLPGSSPAVASRPAPAPAAPSSGGTHTVRSGETFYSIAKQHGIDSRALIAANPDVKPNALRPGQQLRLTGASAPSSPAPAIASAPRSGVQTISNPSPVRETPRPEPEPASPPVNKQPSIRSITVNGEMTYGEFASKYGTDVARLNDLNGLDLADATLLAKGSELYIPAQP